MKIGITLGKAHETKELNSHVWYIPYLPEITETLEFQRATSAAYSPAEEMRVQTSVWTVMRQSLPEQEGATTLCSF